MDEAAHAAAKIMDSLEPQSMLGTLHTQSHLILSTFIRLGIVVHIL